MKKKVFSLMMMLLLAVSGFVRAGEITVHDGTTTNSYIPVWGLWTDNSLQHEFVYPADELAAMNGGEITSMKFYTSSSYANVSWNGSFQVFLKEVGATTLTSFLGTSDATLVYEGSLGVTSQEMVITLATPYTYNGGNLWVGVYYTATTGYSSSYWYGENVTGASIYGRSGSNYSVNSANFLPKTTFAFTGGSGVADQLHVKYMDGDEEVVDRLNLGVRPAGAWMAPFEFSMYTTGATYTVNVLDFTPNDGMFSVTGEELPFQVIRNNDVALNMTVNGTETGVIERQFVAITEGDRAAHIWPVTVELYAPEIPDVWEKACTEATTFPFVEVPANAHHTVLHNDYTLPFPEIPEGYDAVYKLTFAQDRMLNAEVTYGENGKVALYTEDFYGEGGPMATNNYVGPQLGGAAAAPFEAQIGNGTTTTSYCPFYTYYNYSIATALYTAAELEEAGVTTAPMGSISFYATQGTEEQQGITFWMANVADTEVPSTSPATAGMTKVFTGNCTPTVGWNEFVFNQGNFAWDGTSNIMILCQRNNGSYVYPYAYWQAHNPGFYGMGYNYNDGSAYDVENTSHTMYSTSTTRPDILMKSTGRNGNRDIVTIGDGTSSYYHYPVNMYFNYSFTEQLYTPAEIGTAGLINSISFDYAYASSFSMSNVTMYMKNVSRGTFADAYDYEPVTASDIVWNGTFAANAAGWVTINLDTPFQYDGTSNLLVAFYDPTNGYPGSSWTFRTTSTTDYMAISGYSDSSLPDPYDMSNYYGTRHLYRNNIQLDITPNGGGTPGNSPAFEGMAYGPVIENAAIEAGTYYLVASSTDPDFEVTINAQAMPCPAVEGFAFNPQPYDNEDDLEPASVTLRWQIPPYATGWRLVFGSTYYPDPTHPQTVMYPEDGSWETNLANSYTVHNLWNNTNYFWHVEFKNDGCPAGVSSPVWGFTTHLNIPANLVANDYAIFNDEQVTLSWNAIQDRTFRTYYIYRDGVKVGETNTNQINATSFVDGPLAYNMDGYTYYVTAVYDEGESAPSNTINVKVSGRGNVDGHVYEQDGATGIANATVTMVGEDEFGDSHTYNFTTNAQGYYSGAVYAGSYNGQAACDGYQTITEPVQGNPINITNNVTTSPVDYIMDENFDAPCAVFAEYYPDSLDPESPYVKVYWGCGFTPDAMIEDFEDFENTPYEWQNDATYPWVLTTTNPYEGQYCMKSGNQQVLSSTSTMQVTVEIPADGLMSFFGKISCEQSWDFGYFYIDGVQKGSYTGAGNWTERQFDITAGTHTFKWEYTEDYMISDNDDCFYVDYINFYKQPEPPIPGMTYDFENSSFQGWTTIDADGDGYTWVLGSAADGVYLSGGNLSGSGHNSSNDCVTSGSWTNVYNEVLYPDNYFVSPQVELGGMMKFYACAQDANYASEHFGVAVSTTSNSDPNAFTMLQEWTMTAKSVKAPARPAKNARSGRAQGEWYEYTVDLSAYSGMGYVAIRHFNCSDMFMLDVDDITIGEPGKGVAQTRSLHHYNIYRTNCYNDGPYTEDNTVLLATSWPYDTVYIDVEWADLPAGVYKWGVGAVYQGNRGQLTESEISWTEPANVNGATRDAMTYDFEGSLQGWTTIDADGDGRNWFYSMTHPVYDQTGKGHNGTDGFAISASYQDNGGGAFNANNYLVSPQMVGIQNGSSIEFWADYGNDIYPDYFEVCVATAANPTAADFTMVWGGTAKGNGNAKSENREDRAGNWRNHIVDLSAYAGQNVWIAFHHQDYDEYEIYIDDVTINASGAPTPGPTPTPGNNLNQLAEPRESETIWSNCLDKDMWLNGVTVNVLLNSADSPEGTTVDFTNLNEVEQQNYPVDQLVLDGSGFYAFESFRRGDYVVKVEHVGYEPITDTVSIWQNTDLRYVLIEIHYGIENLYVSRTGWAMWDPLDPQQGGSGITPTPTPTPAGDNSFSEGFEGGLNGWTVLNAAGSEATWVHSDNNPGGYDYTTLAHGGTGFAMGYSFIDYDGAYNIDSYLVSPQKYAITNGSTLSFWADNANDSYPENFSVCVATVDNPTVSDFTAVWTGSAKANGGQKAAVRHDANRYENWRSHSVDLSAYAGQNVWIAFHDVNYDAYEVWIDDVELTAGAKNGGDRHLEYYKVMCTSIDGVPIFNHNTVHPFCQLSTNEPYNAPLVEGDHYLCKVACMYSTGLGPWSEPVEWVYEPCDHWGPVDEVSVNASAQGNHIEWVFEHGFNPYGGDTPGPQGGSSFEMNFDGTTFEDWTTIDANGDGYNWMHSHDYTFESMDNEGHNGSFGFAVSESYVNGGVGAITPDNYLVSPQVTLGGTFTFWATDGNDAYGAEHFGVAVSTSGNTNASDFTTINEWTLLAKGNRTGGERQLIDGIWYQYSVDLNAYAGQTGYIAIRHFNCNDQWVLCVDDAVLSNGAKGGMSIAKGGEFYTQYAEDGAMLNFYALDNVDLRAYLLYVLSNDSRFSLVPEEEYGQFILTGSMDEFETVYRNAIADFSLLSKIDIAERIAGWKSSVSSENFTSVIMDVLISNARVDNDHCINSLPFCTSETITFEAANTSNQADENGMDQGCIYSSYNPSFYHMRIHTAGPFVIHMEGHDPNNGTERDIDFCMWGPYTEQEIQSGAACNNLSSSKIMDCCYSSYYSEDCFLGYPDGQHQHNTSHGSINYHMPEVGEYYILMITNYSQQPCVINFTKTEGEGETDCDIVTNPDIIGFLITEDGEYVAFAGPDDREYTVEGEFGDHEYCVRPIYPGQMVLPDHNYGWSMGCPVCEFGPTGGSCAAYMPIHGEALNATDQVKVWWGEENPGPGPSEPFFEDFESGELDGWTAIRNGEGTEYTDWRVVNSETLFSSGPIPAHSGSYVVMGRSWNSSAYNVDNWLITPQVDLGGTLSYWVLDDGQYHENCDVYISTTTNDINAFTLLADPANATSDWSERIVDLTSYNGQRGYIAFRLNDYDQDYLFIDDVAINPGAKNRANIVNFKVYRSTDNANYDLIGTVAYVAGQTYYEYIDTPAGAGTYYYQVTTVYDNDCESEPAAAFDNPNNDYVEVGVTGINENNDKVALYPNPTKGNVTIEANGMSRITVVSMLGQVLFDTELDADVYTLNMAQFNSGMYMVRVYTEEGVTVKRVTVMQ